MIYFLGHDPQALAPKEKDSAEAIGSEVDKEINATAEVRDETVKEVVDSHLLTKLVPTFFCYVLTFYSFSFSSPLSL